MFRIITIFSFLLSSSTHAQEIKVVGTFLEDSTEIGNTISYNLNVSFPKNLEIILTDSSYNYAPFEFIEKSYFPSLTDSVYTYDSVIFHLSSYNINTNQFLKIPIYVLNSNDSSEIFSNIDSIKIKEFIIQISDTLKTKTNTDFSLVNIDFNYPLLVYITFFILSLLIILYLIFRKKVIIYFKTRNVNNQYKKYVYEMDLYFKEINQKFNRKKFELMILQWKRFNEKMSKHPYSTLTTNELIKLGVVGDVNKM